MDTSSGALKVEVLFQSLMKEIAKACMEQLALIDQAHGFFCAGDLCVEAVYLRKELLQEMMTTVKDPAAGADQLAVVYFQQVLVREASFGEGFQKAVALLQDLVVFDQILQIVRVQLCHQRVEEAAALFAATGDDLYIVGGDDHAGEPTDMMREFFIGFACREEFFLAGFPQDTDDVGELACLLEMAFYAEAGGSFLDILLIAAGEIAFGKTEIVDGIEQVCLAYAIVSANAHDPLPELEGSLAIVLELKK